MKLIDRYILRNNAAPFVFGSLTVVFIFLLQFLMNTIDKLLGKGLDEWIIIQLVVLNMAWMVVLAVPMGVLFASLFSFGGMSAAHEVTVIKASGGSLIRMMIPVVIASFFVTGGLFWFNDYVLPEANHQAKILMSDIKRKKPTFSIEAGQFVTELQGYTILSRRVDSLTGMLFGVTIYNDRSGRGTNIASADSGVVEFTPDFESLIVTLFDGEIHQLEHREAENFKKIIFEKYQILIMASGFNFVRSTDDGSFRGDREMDIADMREIVDEAESKANAARSRVDEELREHYDYLMGMPPKDTIANRGMIRMAATGDTSRAAALMNSQKRLGFLKSSVQSDGFQIEEYSSRARQYSVEIWKKYAIPFACIVFVLVGCPLGVMTRGGNFGISAGISLGFYIIYWACLIGGEKLADRGFLSPAFSMWLGNIIVGMLGILLTLRIHHESFRLPGLDFLGRIAERFKRG
ncbi:MAG: LptF/LptG family permease [Candidatus Kapaibacterium sp.]